MQIGIVTVNCICFYFNDNLFSIEKGEIFVQCSYSAGD